VLDFGVSGLASCIDSTIREQNDQRGASGPASAPEFIQSRIDRSRWITLRVGIANIGDARQELTAMFLIEGSQALNRPGLAAK
jgi:hypothetical protein